VQAFEELRTAGTTLLDDKLAPALRAQAELNGSVAAWMKVCIDRTGAITNAWTVKSTTTPIGEAFRIAIADWAFKPFAIRKVATPACGLWLLTYPAAKAPPVETLPAFDQPRVYEIDDIVADDMWTDQVQGIPPPQQLQNVTPTMLETLRVAGSKLIPATASQRKAMVAAGKTRVITSFKVCVDVRGKVSSIKLLKSSGFPDYDALLTSGIRRWGYRPYRFNGAPTPVCTAVTFIYDVATP